MSPVFSPVVAPHPVAQLVVAIAGMEGLVQVDAGVAVVDLGVDAGEPAPRVVAEALVAHLGAVDGEHLVDPLTTGVIAVVAELAE